MEVDAWAQVVIGRPYELTVGKLVRQSAKPPTGRQEETDAHSRAEPDADRQEADAHPRAEPGGGEAPGAPQGFFCSELVAHAYQTLGLLPAARPASGYWPVHFGETEGSRLPLCDGARFGDEIPIEFRTPAVEGMY